MSAILRAAIAYGARGWPVVPLAGKQPWVKAWTTAASTDPAAIRGWWRDRGDSNVGLVTGPRSGFWVLDVDAGRDGLATLAGLEAVHGELATLRSRTGSGGLHLFFSLPAGVELGNRVDVLPGIDVRATGGQVVAPPSVHPDTGLAYAWEADGAPSPAPSWLLDLVRPPELVRRPYVPPPVTDTPDRERRFASQALVGACGDIAGASSGERHRTLHDKAVKLGGYIAAGLLDEALVVAELQRAGEASGKDSREVSRTVRDGIASGKQRPFRPELRQGPSTPPATQAEAIAYWDAHPEMPATEVAQALGVKAETLRGWMREVSSARLPVISPPAAESPPRNIPEIPRNHADDSPSSSPDDETEEGPLDQLTHVVERVRAGDSKQAKAAPLYDLLGDREWLEAMVAARMQDPAAGVAELARLGDAFHGARLVVNQVEAAIKERRKLVVQVAREAARAMPPHPPPGSPSGASAEDNRDERPEIVITTNMPGVINDAIRALHQDEGLPLFQRGGMLVHLTRDASPRGLTWDPEAPILRPLRAPRLREMMSSSARWMKVKQGPQGWDYEAALPATWAVDGVLAREEWPFRRAQGITEIPILRADGSIHEAPGYDSVSGYVHEPPAGFHLRWPQVAFDRELAGVAYERLCEPFADFPFADPWHQAAAVGLLLSMVARPAIDGPVPLFPVLSTTPKSGKTLMVEMIHLIATGREIARAQPGETDEELEKRITVIALGGFPAVLWDNLTSALGGPALDAAVQGRMWQGRILGRSEPVTVPMRTIFIATGNNLAIKGDLAQRVMPIQLEPEVERPELRTDFRIAGGEAGLRAYVKANRADLLAAAFSLLRAHARAGRPVAGTFGGYAEWNTVVRSALVWAGAPDPYQGVAQLADVADERQGQIKGLLTAWYEAYAGESIYVSDLAEQFAAGRNPNFFAAVKAIAATRDGHPDFSRLSWLLRTAAGRIYGGFRLLRSEQLRHGARSWRVTRTTPGPSTPKAEQLDIPY